MVDRVIRRFVRFALAIALGASACGGSEPDAPELSQDDQQAIDRIREAGGDPSKPRQVDFYLYFEERANADAASAELRAESFGVTVERSAANDSWVLLATRRIALTSREFGRAQEKLEAVAHRHGGEYDGWDAPVEP